jgi:serum/glucocorticoid-regulated kinase 2
MSWKLTKSMFSWSPISPSKFCYFINIGTDVVCTLAELKETHLAPLTQTFTRSSSTSTIKGDSGEETQAAAQTPTISSSASSNGIGMFESRL